MSRVGQYASRRVRVGTQDYRRVHQPRHNKPCRSFPSQADCRSAEASTSRPRRASAPVWRQCWSASGLGAVKIIAGLVGHSYALIADGVESMLDVVSGLVVAGSLKIAAQPPDEKYPFGYGKVEPAAALVDRHRLVGRRRRHRHPERARDSHAASCAGAVHARRARAGRRDRRSCCFASCFAPANRSTAMRCETDAWHHRSDSLTSLAAFIGISIALVGGKGYEPADDWAALFAAGVIAFNGVRLFRTAWREIMDASLPESVIDDIREIARQRRRRGRHRHVPRAQERLGLWVDIHVEVPRRHDGPRRPRDRTSREGRTAGIQTQCHGRRGPYRAGRRNDDCSAARSGRPRELEACASVHMLRRVHDARC